MRLLSIIAVCILLFAVLPALADKITEDPNKGDAEARSEAVADKQLDIPVTYMGGYKRLYEVTDDLSRLTGVKISCGQSSKDWQVRDLPLVVCVKDLPLGVVLKRIADAMRVDIKRETIGSDKSAQRSGYRLIANESLRRDLDAFYDEFRRKQFAEIEWAWNKLEECAAKPRSAYNVSLADNGFTLRRFQSAMAFAELVAAISPETKERIMAGEAVDMHVGNSPYRKQLHKLYSRVHEEQWKAPEGEWVDCEPPAPIEEGAWREPSDEIMDLATFSFRLAEYPGGNVSLSFNAGNIKTKYGEMWLNILPILVADELQGYLTDKSTRNDRPENSYSAKKPDVISTDLVEIPNRHNRDSNGYQYPKMITKKVKLELPDDEEITPAEFLEALSEVSGCNIIAEDFISHKDPAFYSRNLSDQDPDEKVVFCPVKEACESEMVVDDILSAFFKLYGNGLSAYVNENENIIVIRSTNWDMLHRNLMPKSALDNLEEKGWNKGLGLDDIADLMLYDDSQISEWVGSSRALGYVGPLPKGSKSSDIIWQLYARLSPEDRAMARSDAGLALGKFDTNWFADFVSYVKKKDTCNYLVSWDSEEEKKKALETEEEKIGLLRNPELLRMATFKVVAKPASMWHRIRVSQSGTTFRGESIPEGMNKAAYHALIEGMRDGCRFTAQYDEPDIAFPLYHPKKEKQVSGKSLKFSIEF